jgi:hypothetical protein
MTTGRMAMIRITELKLAHDAAFEPPDAATPPPLQTSSGATPASLLAANKSGVARPSLKLSGTPHPSVANPTDAKFETAVADTSSDTPPIAIVALSGLAAVAALTFAALLFLKNQ